MVVEGRTMVEDYFQVSSYARYLLTLGLKEDASFDTCHAAYLKLLKQWHPDRFAFDDPQRDVAEQKTKEITGAFERLKRLKFRDQLLVGGSHSQGSGDTITSSEARLYDKLERMPIRVNVKN